VNDKVKQILVCRPCPAEKTEISFLFTDLRWTPTYNLLLNLETLQAVGSLNAEIMNDTGIVFENISVVLSTRNVYFPVLRSARALEQLAMAPAVATSANRVFTYPLQQGKIGKHSIIPLQPLAVTFTKFALIVLGRSTEGSALLLYRFSAPRDLPSGDIKLFALCGSSVGEYLGSAGTGDKMEGEIIDVELAHIPDVKYNAVIQEKVLEENASTKTIERDFTIMVRTKVATQLLFAYNVNSTEVLKSPSNSMRRGNILEFVVNVPAGVNKVEFELITRELK
jgi:hypothetical protein